jgi:hypothetical protein
MHIPPPFFVICLMCVQVSPLLHLNNHERHVTFLALCMDAPLPTCRTNVAVRSLGRGGWSAMSIGLL